MPCFILRTNKYKAGILRAGVAGPVGRSLPVRSHGPQFDPRLCRGYILLLAFIECVSMYDRDVHDMDNRSATLGKETYR